MPEPTLLITTRGLRVLYTLQAFAIGGLALLLGSIGIDARLSTDDAWASLPPEQALAAAPCPEPGSIDLGNANEGRLAAAREGEFQVFGDEPTRLGVPVDWSDDPLGARRYRQNLHKLRFLEPLLASWRESGNSDDLALALALAADWIRQNPRGRESTPPEAWSDKVTGDRVPYLAYLVRAAGCEGLLQGPEQRALLQALDEHGAVLVANELYTPDNHGLFVDLGLVRLTDFLPFLPRAGQWRELARERFEKTLRGRLADGLWLEHSTAYQFLAIRALERMIDELGGDAELQALLEEMRQAAAWLIKPSGEMTQFGDSDQEKVPDWAASSLERDGLFAALEAGFAVVRAPGPDGEVGYLAVTDGFHNLTHKHADELSFELFDKGLDIVDDTGLYDKDPGPIRDFVVSNRAHSTLTADGLDLAIDDEAMAYGSGLDGVGSGDGWFAIEGRNRLLARSQGIDHRRLFLYRPGELLVIVDRVRSGSPHTYARYLHLGREIEAGAPVDTASGIRISLEPTDGAIVTGPGTVPSTVTQTRGQDEPLQGFTSPSFRRLVPRTTVALASQGGSETLVATFALDAGIPVPSEVIWRGKGVEVGFDDARTVTSTRSGEEIAVADSAP